MNDQNNELMAITEMNINNHITFENIYNKFFKHQNSLPPNSPHRITKQDIIVVDSNSPVNELKKIVQYCAERF
jgi:hypothetical protein